MSDKFPTVEEIDREQTPNLPPDIDKFADKDTVRDKDKVKMTK